MYSGERELCSVPLNNESGDAGAAYFGWTQDEHLVTVSRRGHFQVFELHGEEVFKAMVSDLMVPSTKSDSRWDGHIDRCVFHSEGIAALTRTGRILVVDGIRFPDHYEPCTPSAYLLLEPAVVDIDAVSAFDAHLSDSTGTVRVFIALKSRAVVVADRYYSYTVDLSTLLITEPIERFAVCDNGNFVCSATRAGVAVTTSGFDSKVSE
jgi:hypothetical protein